MIDGNVIAGIGPDLTSPGNAEVIGGGLLLMPALVNAHTHSCETFFRGRYEGLPLELWLLNADPLLLGPLPPLRIVYLRSLLLAMESLRSGVTTIRDDFFNPPRYDHERLAMVFKAYDAIGNGANVGSAVMNILPLDALPFAREILPDDLQPKLDCGPMITPGEPGMP